MWQFSPLRIVGWFSLLLGVKGQMPFPAEIELSDLDGLNGFTLNGNRVQDWTGYWVSGGGDLNGDGIPDFTMGAHGAFPDGKQVAGDVYVMFGRAGLGSRGIVELRGLGAPDGLILHGATTGDRTGIAVSIASDVNGDDIDDLLITTYRTHYAPANGQVYLVFGHRNLGQAGPIALAELNGTDGLSFHPDPVEGLAALSIAGAGDVNADGIADILIGADLATTKLGGGGAGRVYVVFGGSHVGKSGDVNLMDLQETDGFALDGAQASERFGSAVAGLGDVNADGIDDFAVGAYRAGPAGRAYVIFGKKGLRSQHLPNLDGTTGFEIRGEQAGDNFGFSLAGAGDINGDGINDIVIGAWGRDSPQQMDTGSAYVVFGGTGIGGRGIVQAATLRGGDGFVLYGVNASDRTGGSVAGPADVNGDGIDDLLIGAGGADPEGLQDAGRAYVVFGYRDIGRSSGALMLSSLNGTNGFAANGIYPDSHTGGSVSGAGDLNRDGIPDILVGANRANQGIGKIHVLFGRKPSPATLSTIGTVMSTGTTPLLSAVSTAPTKSMVPSGSADGTLVALVITVVGLVLSLCGGAGLFWRGIRKTREEETPVALRPAVCDDAEIKHIYAAAPAGTEQQKSTYSDWPRQEEPIYQELELREGSHYVQNIKDIMPDQESASEEKSIE